MLNYDESRSADCNRVRNAHDSKTANHPSVKESRTARRARKSQRRRDST